MMAHELPLQAHGAPHHSPAPKTRKSKHHQAKIQLPNGQKPDFGPAKHQQQHQNMSYNQLLHQQQRPPQLPNGEKPDFGTGELSKIHGKRDGKAKKKKSNAKKGETSGLDNALVSPSSSSSSASDGHDARSSGKNMECYAGSSFHSSPEAVALPKPSFASGSVSGSGSGSALAPSPSQKLGNPANLPHIMGPILNAPGPSNGHMVAPIYRSPAQQIVHPVPSGAGGLAAPTSGQYNLHPAFVYQGVPGSGPPRYPITSYPASKQEYSYPMPRYANGPIPSAGPMNAVPPLHPYHHPYPLAPVAAANASPYQSQPLSQSQSGQRISFNDLISSSK